MSREDCEVVLYSRYLSWAHTRRQRARCVLVFRTYVVSIRCSAGFCICKPFVFLL